MIAENYACAYREVIEILKYKFQVIKYCYGETI